MILPCYILFSNMTLNNWCITYIYQHTGQLRNVLNIVLKVIGYQYENTGKWSNLTFHNITSFVNIVCLKQLRNRYTHGVVVNLLYIMYINMHVIALNLPVIFLFCIYFKKI